MSAPMDKTIERDLSSKISHMIYKHEEKYRKASEKSNYNYPRFWCAKIGGGSLTEEIIKLLAASVDKAVRERDEKLRETIKHEEVKYFNNWNRLGTNSHYLTGYIKKGWMECVRTIFDTLQPYWSDDNILMFETYDEEDISFDTFCEQLIEQAKSEFGNKILEDIEPMANRRVFIGRDMLTLDIPQCVSLQELKDLIETLSNPAKESAK